MAVTNVTEDLPSGGGTLAGGDGRNYERFFIVETDSFADNAISVLEAPGLPHRYDWWQKGNDVDYEAVALRAIPRRDTGDPLTWRITYEYETVMDPTSPQTGLPSSSITIEGRLPQINISEITYEEAVYQEYKGKTGRKKIVNAAGEPYPEMPTITKKIRVYDVERWYRTFEALQADDSFANTVNNAVVWGLPAGSLRCLGAPGGSRAIDNYGTYWRSKLILQHKSPDWKVRLENRGYFELDATGQLVRMMDDNDQFLTEPAFLAADGKKLDPAAAPPAPLEFEIYKPVDFGGLNLPPLDIAIFVFSSPAAMSLAQEYSGWTPYRVDSGGDLLPPPGHTP